MDIREKMCLGVVRRFLHTYVFNPKNLRIFKESGCFLLVTYAWTSSWPQIALAMIPKEITVDPELASTIVLLRALGSCCSIRRAAKKGSERRSVNERPSRILREYLEETSHSELAAQ